MKRWILGVLLVTGCKTAPSEDQCRQLLEHFVDLEFKKAGAADASGTATKADIASQKKAVSDAKAGEFIDFCVRRIAKERVECSLSAGDLDAVARCDETK